MEPEQLRQAPMLFFSTKRPEQGSGVGLAIVRQLLQVLEGRITLASEAGEGTTVTVRLPVGDAAASPHLATSDRPGSPQEQIPATSEP